MCMITYWEHHIDRNIICKQFVCHCQENIKVVFRGRRVRSWKSRLGRPILGSDCNAQSTGVGRVVPDCCQGGSPWMGLHGRLDGALLNLNGEGQLTVLLVNQLSKDPPFGFFFFFFFFFEKWPTAYSHKIHHLFCFVLKSDPTITHVYIYTMIP